MRSKLKWVLVGVGLLLLGELASRLLDSQNSNDALFNYFFLDEKMLRQGMIDEGGIFEDGFEVRVNRRGFRDRKSWPPPPKTDARRIVLGGAGHGYAENISEGFIYAHRLEGALRKRHSTAEVYNLSVQGSTILFFERALLDEVIEAKPDAVLLSYSGFNEALYTYLPEAEVLFPHNGLYNVVMSSALFRRLHLLAFGLSQQVHRVTPDEMIDSYRRVVTRLRDHGIEVLILQQLVIHPDIEGLWRLADMDTYRARVANFAEEEGIPLADPEPFCQDLEACFEQAEWYSEAGHRAAAQALEVHHGVLLDE